MYEIKKEDELFDIDENGNLVKIDFHLPSRLGDYCQKILNQINFIEMGDRHDIREEESKIRIIKFTIEKLMMVNDVYSKIRSLQSAMGVFPQLDKICATLFEERKRLLDLLVLEVKGFQLLGINKHELNEAGAKYQSKEYYDKVDIKVEKDEFKVDGIEILDKLGETIEDNEERTMDAPMTNPIKGAVMTERSAIKDVFTPRVIKATKQAIKKLEQSEKRIAELSYIDAILFLFPKSKRENMQLEEHLSRTDGNERDLARLRERRRELNLAMQDINNMTYPDSYRKLYKSDRIIRKIKKQLRAIAIAARKEAGKEKIKHDDMQQNVDVIVGGAQYSIDALNDYSRKVEFNEENTAERENIGDRFIHTKDRLENQIDQAKFERGQIKKKPESPSKFSEIESKDIVIARLNDKLKAAEVERKESLENIRDIVALPEKYVNMRDKLRGVQEKTQKVVGRERR